MSRAIYTSGENFKNCTYTPPQNQDVNVYLTQLDTMLSSFKSGAKKDLTLSRLDTMSELLTAVILKNPDSLYKTTR
jgi:hypothetical protein